LYPENRRFRKIRHKAASASVGALRMDLAKPVSLFRCIMHPLIRPR
jgi:hypothetical protein